jgi:hypothetical protein
MRVARPVLGSAMIILLTMSGCDRPKRQYELEGHAAKDITKVLSVYDSLARPPVTNLAQVFASLEIDYPYFWHERFVPFGKQAGFSNSFFEKYVVLPRGITNRWVHGEIFMMNAKPFGDHQGALERGVFSKVDRQYAWQVVPEDEIQAMLRETGISEPTPQPMPSPPPKPKHPFADSEPSILTELSNVIVAWGLWLGLSERGALVFRHAVFAAPFILLPLLAMFVWRRTRSKRE